ncbi:hypothetical protein KIN20_007362 [Parelaphostrongylus tenuis]|uniref:7TM GPCR serpentine receptor class x (Srx) domain-containing protein n=1 Tax=Parelaphostrongylus tenuis TaxID=148309 RepID=A0AAD5QLZ3_PARTN|nr:hypothetical protein KIN20_007362 [Parelaphostrongylus tenuis]
MRNSSPQTESPTRMKLHSRALILTKNDARFLSVYWLGHGYTSLKSPTRLFARARDALSDSLGHCSTFLPFASASTRLAQIPELNRCIVAVGVGVFGLISNGTAILAVRYNPALRSSFAETCFVLFDTVRWATTFATTPCGYIISATDFYTCMAVLVAILLLDCTTLICLRVKYRGLRSQNQFGIYSDIPYRKRQQVEIRFFKQKGIVQGENSSAAPLPLQIECQRF